MIEDILVLSTALAFWMAIILVANFIFERLIDKREDKYFDKYDGSKL